MTIQIQIDHGKPKQGVVLEREIGKLLLSGSLVNGPGLLESSDGTKIITVDVQIMPESTP